MNYAPLVLLMVVMSVASPVGLAQTGEPTEGTVVGNPSLDVVATETQLTWGDNQSLTFAVTNTGALLRGGPERFEQRVTTARNVRVEVATDRIDPALANKVSFQNSNRLLGELGRGTASPVSLSVDVRDSLSPGTYQIPLRLTYQYTAVVRYGDGDPLYTDRTTTRRVTVPLVVTDRPQLTVTAAPFPQLSPGENNTLSVTLSNTGTQTATDIGLTVSADTPVHFGDTRTRQISFFVPDLAPGSNRTLTVPVAVQPLATPSTYLLRLSAVYTTPTGFDRTSDQSRFGLRVVVNETEATSNAELLDAVVPYSVRSSGYS